MPIVPLMEPVFDERGLPLFGAGLFPELSIFELILFRYVSVRVVSVSEC